MNREFAGVFNSEVELLHKIHELHENGIAENNMYIVTKDKEDVSIVRGRTDVEVQKTEASWWERFTSFLSDEQPAKKALHRMDLTEEEASHYLQEVDRGAFLLYVDKGDFWDAAEHDRGDLTSTVEQKINFSSNGVANDDVGTQREQHLEDLNAQHQSFRNKL